MRTGWMAGVAAAAFLISTAAALTALTAHTAHAQPQNAAPVASAASAAQANYRFRSIASTRGLPLGSLVLSASERAFIASLPEIRVALAQPPAQPYENIAPDGLITGIHPEMLVALANIFGLRVRPVVLPDWPSMLRAAQAREVDLVLSIGITPPRLDYLAFTLGTTPLPGGLFARRGAQIDPARTRYAVERDFVAQDWLHRQYPQATLLVVEDTSAALNAVASGQADAYMGSLLAATEKLARQPVADVELNRIVSYGTGHYHFGVRKDWAPLVAILNKGIQSLRVSRVADPRLLAYTPELPASTPGLDLLPQLLSLSPAEASELAARSVWRVGAVRGLALLNEVDARGTHSGIAAEYTEQLARRLGVGMQIVSFDSVAAMLDGLRNKAIDVVPFLTRTRARERDFAYSEPYIEMPYVLVGRMDGPLYWGLDSLRGQSLALTAQHPLIESLAATHPDIRIVPAAPGYGAMDSVLRGDADAAVEVKLYANLRINEAGGEKLRVLAEVGELPAQFNFAVRQGETALLSMINRGLADIAPAERERMLRRWVAVDLQPRFPWHRYAPLLAVVALAVLGFVAVTWLWTRRLQHEVVARRRSEQLLTDIAANVPGVAFRYMLALDGALKHHFFTPGARALLGMDLDPRATVLDTLAARGDAAEVAEGRAAQARSLRSGEPFEFTGRYAHPDGRTRWLRVHAVRTRSDDDTAAWTGYIIDVSSERHLQERLSREAQSRNLLLASASHELRAPTHTLSLALQALPRAGLSEAQTRALQIAEDSAGTLSELLGDLLDTARTGHEALQLRPRSFDVHQMLEDLGRAWRSAARTKGLDFELRIEADVPRTLATDPLRLKQVLINLLSNACKYTAAGQVTLQASMAGDALRLLVTDTGIGISEEAQTRLFKPYVTLNENRHTTLPEGSTGLGLASSRRLAELLGAQLELHSAPGRGTRVSLTLPLPQAEASGAAAEAATAGQVLVCDDDEVSRMLLCQMLRSAGFRVCEAGRCEDALARWRQGGVQVLITDLDLPGMDGLALIRAIRASEGGAPARTRARIVVCSGGPVPAADAQGAAPLHDAYLVKPVLLTTLTDTLQRLGVSR